MYSKNDRTPQSLETFALKKNKSLSILTVHPAKRKNYLL